jgi:hypothetical protein
MERSMSLVFDLETDGLYNDVTQIHCLAIHDLNEAKTYTFNDQGNQEPVSRGVQMLMDADSIIGHNIIGYDLPVLDKLFPWYSCPSSVVDTLLLSRLYHADIMKLDQRRKWDQMPLQMYGRHSLEAYGYRLKCYKGQYGKTTDWSLWSQDMEDYCVQDVNVTTKLWHHFVPYLTGSR